MKKRSRKTEQSKDFIYKAGKTFVKGNPQNKIVQSTVRMEQYIRIGWLLAALIALLFYHTATPAVLGTLHQVLPSISTLRNWFNSS